MKQKLLMTVASLLVLAQVALADTWDGVTYTEPEYQYKYVQISEPEYDVTTSHTFDVLIIHSAAQMAYIWKHFKEIKTINGKDLSIWACCYELTTDIDMGDAVPWISMGNDNSSPLAFDGYFLGNGHTIRLHTSGATTNYQGLFARIGESAEVRDLHVTGTISCESSRLVGGIAGENYGSIRNCWVSADVSSDWHYSSSAYDAKVGGITGENSGRVKYCCMSGNVRNDDSDVGGIVGCNNSGATVEHVTFYGTRISSHAQDNVYIGDFSGTLTNEHTDFDDDDALETYLAPIHSYYELYREALRYPFTVTVANNGNGTIVADITKTRPGKTITLTTELDNSLRSLAVKNADGNDIDYSNDASDKFTFTMPRRDVTATANFVRWEGNGTEDNPWLLKTEDDFYCMKTYSDEDFQRFERFFTVMYGTYNLKEDVTTESRLTISDEVNLNTGEGTTLNAKKGIELSEGNKLVLGGSGTLTIDNCDEDKSGIGAYTVGILVINSGTVNVTGGEKGAALGGDIHNNKGGSITINGGVVNATGGDYAAAIGGGSNDWDGQYGVCGDIVINGGQVTAIAGKNAPGAIGWGYQRAGSYGNNTGTLTLGWTKETDFVNSTYAVNTIKLVKPFLLDGTSSIATPTNITGNKIVPFANAVLFNDDEDNSTVISENDNQVHHVVLYGRTLWRDGSWNTLCLPFGMDVKNLTGTPLEGATVMELDNSEGSKTGFDESTSTLTLEFVDANAIEPGHAYIVKWDTPNDIHVVNPVFKNVTIQNENPASQSVVSHDGYVTFVGIYNPVNIYTTEKTNLYMGSNNHLYYPWGEGMTEFKVNSFRAYFQLNNGLACGESTSEGAGINNIVLNFGDETQIKEISNLKSQTTNSTSWYSLDGRMLSEKPTQKGIYINNGKKVVIK